LIFKDCGQKRHNIKTGEIVMFGFIKNLITGILNFFIGLFGGKKGGYYMELDESSQEKPKNTAKLPAKEAPAAKQSEKESPKQPAENGKTATEPVTATVSTKQNGTKEAAAPVKPEPAKVELVQTANGVKAEPAKKTKADAAKVVQEPPKDSTFAPKYLAVPSTNNGRRRPGANMNPFLDMARQVKTPARE
jgi:hypothetical protein